MSTSSGRLPVFFPTQLNLYRQCPERYLHERVERRRINQPISAALARGIAQHKLLSDLARSYQENAEREPPLDGPAVPGDLLACAETSLPRDGFVTETEWRAAVFAVFEGVQYGLSCLDGATRVLASEATYFYRYEHSTGCPPFILGAKVDLVLLRTDENGLPFLDVVDFKSGSTLRPDSLQELAIRVVVSQSAASFNVPHERIRTTTVSLGGRVTHSIFLGRAEAGRRWIELKSIVAAILEGDSWGPTPSPLCDYCPFFNTICSLNVQSARAGTIAAWLDGAAD